MYGIREHRPEPCQQRRSPNPTLSPAPSSRHSGHRRWRAGRDRAELWRDLNCTSSAGRPAGNDNTRSTILDSARKAFAANGFNGASIRGIAADAGVDPSTVIHFFGTKDGLFAAVVKDVAQLAEPLLHALQREESGRDLVRTYLGIWEQEEAGAAMRAIIRTAIGSDTAMELFRDSMSRPMREAAGGKIKGELVMMQLICIGLARSIMKLPELAAADADVIAEQVGPLLDNIRSRRGR